MLWLLIKWSCHLLLFFLLWMSSLHCNRKFSFFLSSFSLQFIPSEDQEREGQQL